MNSATDFYLPLVILFCLAKFAVESQELLQGVTMVRALVREEGATYVLFFSPSVPEIQTRRED
jgi:hypothetical protein